MLQDALDEADRRVAVAAEDAERRVAAARQEVDRLRDLRVRLATQLRSAREVLVGAAPLLAPGAAEAETVEEPARSSAIPQQRAMAGSAEPAAAGNRETLA